MKTAVVYKSKSGHTETYSRWLSEELKGDLIHFKKASMQKLKKYDIIIFGGGVYANSINGKKFVKKLIHSFPNKKIFSFATGAAPANSSTIEKLSSHNYTEEELSKHQFFYFRGGFDLQKLHGLYRFIMKTVYSALKKKPESELTEDDKGLLNMLEKPFDEKRKENLKTMIRKIKAVS